MCAYQSTGGTTFISRPVDSKVDIPHLLSGDDRLSPIAKRKKASRQGSGNRESPTHYDSVRQIDQHPQSAKSGRGGSTGRAFQDLRRQSDARRESTSDPGKDRRISASDGLTLACATPVQGREHTDPCSSAPV